MLRCKCHGLSGSCGVKTCIRVVPSIFEIGDIVKEKYEDSVKVNVILHGSTGQATLEIVDQRRYQDGAPTIADLVYLEMPANYCSVSPEYTTSRYCMPQADLTSELRKFYPPCEEFCCSGEYHSARKTINQLCNCYFQFCCDLKCQTCEEAFMEYRCTSATNQTSSS